MDIQEEHWQCPLCGGNMYPLGAYHDMWGRYSDWWIECTECGAAITNPTNGWKTAEEMRTAVANLKVIADQADKLF